MVWSDNRLRDSYQTFFEIAKENVSDTIAYAVAREIMDAIETLDDAVKNKPHD